MRRSGIPEAGRQRDTETGRACLLVSLSPCLLISSVPESVEKSRDKKRRPRSEAEKKSEEIIVDGPTVVFHWAEKSAEIVSQKKATSKLAFGFGGDPGIPGHRHQDKDQPC